MSGNLFLNLVALFIAAGILGLTLFTTFRDRKRWYQYIAVLVWSLHLGIFYGISVLRTVGAVGPDIGAALHYWSLVLRFHDIITVSCLIYLIRLRDTVNG